MSKENKYEFSDDEFEELREKFADLLDTEALKTVMPLPDKVNLYFKLEEGDNLIDILPYIASENNPKVYANPKNKGKAFFRLQILAHRNIGVINGWYACPGNWGEPCPCCQESKKKYEEANKATGKDANDIKDAAYDLKARERNVYIVRPYIGDVPANYLQVYHTPYKKSFGEKLVEASEGRKGQRIRFAHPSKEDGRIVIIKGKEATFNGRKFIDAVRVDFDMREEAVPEAILEAVPCIDQFIKKYTYDELSEILYGAGGAVSEEEDGTVGSMFDDYETPEEREEVIPEKSTVDSPACPFEHTLGEWYESSHETDCKKCEKLHKGISETCAEKM